MSKLEKIVMHRPCRKRMEPNYQRNGFDCPRCHRFFAVEDIRSMIERDEVDVLSKQPVRNAGGTERVETVDQWKGRVNAELEMEYKELCRKNGIKNPPPFLKIR